MIDPLQYQYISQYKGNSRSSRVLVVIVRKLHDTKVFVTFPILLINWCKLGKYTLVQWKAHCVVLLNRSVEQTLHHTMITNTLDDVTLQSMLGGDTCRHEPLRVLDWIGLRRQANELVVRHKLDANTTTTQAKLTLTSSGL